MNLSRTLAPALLALALSPACAHSQEFRAPVNHSTMSAPAQPSPAAMPGVPDYILEMERKAAPTPPAPQPSLADAPEKFDFAYNKIRLLAPFGDEKAMLDGYFWERGDLPMIKHPLVVQRIEGLYRSMGAKFRINPYGQMLDRLNRLTTNDKVQFNERLPHLACYEVEGLKGKYVVFDLQRHMIIAWEMDLDGRHVDAVVEKLSRNHGAPAKLTYNQKGMDFKGLDIGKADFLLWQSRRSVALIAPKENRLYMINSEELEKATSAIFSLAGENADNTRRKVQQHLQ